MGEKGAARPVGYFVHHQGRGHAERAAAIANALIERRPVTLFCAKPSIFPALDDRIAIIEIPSLFEATGHEAPAMAVSPMPTTTHCAPLGWPSITTVMARIVRWFEEARPALFITDVSAEIAQLARLCSIPHICVLQHGNRADAGHMAAYEGAVGLLAPYHARLEQADRPQWMRDRTHYASGVGIVCSVMASRMDARQQLGLDADAQIVLVVAGGGGEGTPSAPLSLGARGEPDTQWITIGQVQTAWHETPPGNLDHRGWIDNPRVWIAAADRIVSSAGNTTVHMVLAAAKPWVVIPEWRYFDEQLCKADVLAREGLAAVAPHWPSHADAWHDIWKHAAALDHAAQAQIVTPDAADRAAQWIDDHAVRLWNGHAANSPALDIVA
ncbi:MAG: hypothetical protein WA948_13115 [Pontixanthobacter sp.]